MISNRLFRWMSVAVLAGGVAASAYADGGNNPDAKWATDAYPGFDCDYEDLRPEKKEPRLLSFWYGVNRATPAEQLEYAQELERGGSDSKARRAYDALVREWPIAPEAAVAQQELANLILTKFREYDNAFDEFRYLLDFYPSRCDYHTVCRKLYEIASVMREEGKTLLWFRFSNATDVRHRFESLIVRSPGEDFVRKALLTVAELREEELNFDEAVKVYESLRNHYPDTEEGVESYYFESRARIRLLRSHGYNRNRLNDTISFFGYAEQAKLADDRLAEIGEWRLEALQLADDEAFAAAKFYDSRTRTKRSAISAYERFLAEHPDSAHAEEARVRVDELKGEAK